MANLFRKPNVPTSPRVPGPNDPDVLAAQQDALQKRAAARSLDDTILGDSRVTGRRPAPSEIGRSSLLGQST